MDPSIRGLLVTKSITDEQSMVRNDTLMTAQAAKKRLLTEING